MYPPVDEKDVITSYSIHYTKLYDFLRLVPTPRAQPIAKQEESSGLVLMGASPVRNSAGESLGVLYGGVLVNRNFGIVDHVWEILYVV